MSARILTLVITLLAITEMVLGGVLIFLSQEVAGWLFSGGAAPPVLLSLIGAALFGFGQLNWMTRNAAIGGIYGRPVVMANLVHFVVGGLALALAKAAETPWLWIAATFYLAGAVLYGLLLYRSPAASSLHATSPSH